ncbi:hypothetical protein cyc_06657 [Cyclospora cayetanensis]|uniref:Uncharacterized protein n=1 Tax=Cyclospora cayetanensis TaxID=88456 RepID=A0A1D3CRR7_9EIME|nr:hypothetical protein cyc_06657 [Cyclospora cayetanensis]
MGNSASADDKPKRIATKDLCCHTYVHTYKEGDAELPEDPDFPKRLLDQTRSFDFSNQVKGGNGTYIFYPNKDKPKMWVGQYKCLNPGDLLCNQGCPLDPVEAAECGNATAECVDPSGLGLMQCCMPDSNAYSEPLVTELPGGTAYATAPSMTEEQQRFEQAQRYGRAKQAHHAASQLHSSGLLLALCQLSKQELAPCALASQRASRIEMGDIVPLDGRRMQQSPPRWLCVGLGGGSFVESRARLLCNNDDWAATRCRYTAAVHHTPYTVHGSGTECA